MVEPLFKTEKICLTFVIKICNNQNQPGANEEFLDVESVPRNNVQNFKSIPDIRKIHCVRTTLNRSEWIVSDLSCYTCDQCIASNYDSCLNFRSRPVKVISELCTDDSSSSDGHTFNSGETISDLITSDTIIAVVAEDDESDFYLMKTVAEPEILSKNVTDDWGISFPRGASVVKGFYYDIVSKRNFSYKLIPKRVAINNSVSARYILTESELTKTGNKIKLNEDMHMNILSSLDDI